ncbi:MAG: Hsp20/alpha crystallin family protein [Chloroflexota bacterium]|nr:Hsp20/alpha crystallin family protein [Chloroflexota bacterium]
MSSSRWDPLGDIVSLREAMNNLLEESFVRPRPGVPGAAAGLAVDVHETADTFVVIASVPGVPAADVDITVLGDTLRIRGERRDDREESGENGRWLIRERRFGAFERSVALPSAVKSGEANADFKDGVLTVTLPKAEEAKPRSIPVRAATAPAPSEEPKPSELQPEPNQS